MKSLRLTITDTGIGITEEQARTLFEPFSQADSSTTRKFGGTGLGLVLSRFIANALGGDLRLESSGQGKGSTFVVTVAATAAVKPDRIITPNHLTRLDRIKVLLVEDSVDMQELIKEVLEKRGAVVDIAGDGKEGIKKAKAVGYDVILMDMQMPVLDGYSATKELRALGFNIPIIALTAHAMKDERIKTMDAGCSAHLTKPIAMNLLIETIKEFSDRPIGGHEKCV